MESKKQIIETFAIEGNFDKKHKLNLCNKRVPTALLEQVERGCSIETLEQIAAGYPICKYRTQITVHGLFDEPKSGYVGGYKNLVRNQNGSLGIRWSAIDVEKRHGLYKVARLYGWKYSESSNDSYFYKEQTATDKATAIKIYNEFKAESAKIDTKLFCGFADVVCYSMFGFYYIILKVSILCFYERNTTALLNNLTGSTESERATALEQAERAAAEQRAKREQERATALAEQAERAAERATALAEWSEQNPMPTAFVEKHGYTLKTGDIYCIGARELSEGGFGYVFYKVATAFGNLTKTRCNEQGDKIAGAKGSKLNKPTREKVFVRDESHGQTTKPEKATAANKNVVIIDYSEKAFAVIGDTKPYLNKFKSMGGKFNRYLKGGAGWIFSKNKVTHAELIAVVGC